MADDGSSSKKIAEGVIPERAEATPSSRPEEEPPEPPPPEIDIPPEVPDEDLYGRGLELRDMVVRGLAFGGGRFRGDLCDEDRASSVEVEADPSDLSSLDLDFEMEQLQQAEVDNAEERSMMPPPPPMGGAPMGGAQPSKSGGGDDANLEVDLLVFAGESSPAAAPSENASDAAVPTAAASSNENVVFGPELPSSSNGGSQMDQGDMGDFEDNPLAGLFDNLTADNAPSSNSASNDEKEDVFVKSEDAVAGVCGFRNFANTCYMNSGLQCLFATPTVVKFFTENNSVSSWSAGETKGECQPQLQSQSGSQQSNGPAAAEPSSSSPSETATAATAAALTTSISGRFGPLVKDVWAGEYATLKPYNFKSTLELTHPQFKGNHQHDCQEFLSLLLGSLHEELKANTKNGEKHAFNKANSSYGCGTSMELHTSHSTEREIPATLHWLSKQQSRSQQSSLENNNFAAATATTAAPSDKAAAVAASSPPPPPTSQQQQSTEAAVPSSTATSTTTTTAAVAAAAPDSCSAAVDSCLDGTESRGSTSPKSYDSVSSSIEDKVTSAIRKLPIPNEVKLMTSSDIMTSSAMTEEDFDDDNRNDVDEDVVDEDEEEEEDVTSNLVSNETLKKRPAAVTAAAAASPSSSSSKMASEGVTNNHGGGGSSTANEF